MISSEVQRTLVKSPPELWAELSDPAALARHLGELGEIRIVRAEPESTVEWAAGEITGTVSIKPSGWGTKVTLSVTRELAELVSESERTAEVVAKPTAEAAPAAEAKLPAEPAAEPVTEAKPATETKPAAEAAPTEPEPEREPRRGFFARLFGRRRRAEPLESSEKTVTAAPLADLPADLTAPVRSPGQPDAFVAVRQALAQEILTTTHPFASVPDVESAPEPLAIEQETQAEQVENISSELMAAEDVAAEEATAEEVTAVLTAVLDRLGAAHHRPFSRA
jgi:hypothetical protein